LTGRKGRFEIPKHCKKILQCLILKIEDGKAVDVKKIKFFDTMDMQIAHGLVENLE